MFTALAFALLLSAQTDALKPQVGDAAPGFALPSSTGRAIRLADYKGKKKVVLAFFPKAFTGGCTKEMSGLRDNQKAFDEAEAQILGISMDSVATQTKFADSLKLTFPILSDPGGKTATAYGVKGALWANRTTFIIDQNGKITSILEGKDAIDPGLTVAACKANAP